MNSGKADAQEEVTDRADGVMPFHGLVLAVILPPLAAFATLFAFGADAPLGPALLAALPPAYLLGAVPALLAGVLDRHLARRGVGKLLRLAVAAGLAATAGLGLLAPALLTGRIQGPSFLLFPASLAASAVVALGLVMTAGALSSRWVRSPRVP